MIITPNKFALLIEDMVKNKRMSYMDAIIQYCSENGGSCEFFHFQALV